MSLNKKADIRPDKNRWPVKFLNDQLQKLVVELSGCERWKRNSAADLREPVEDFIITGNESDRAPIEAHRSVIARGLECSAEKLQNIQTARLLISEDLKSGGAHNYGKCVDCGKFINSRRLIASPWVQKCVQCQKASEESLSQKNQTIGVRSLAARPRNLVHRG